MNIDQAGIIAAPVIASAVLYLAVAHLLGSWPFNSQGAGDLAVGESDAALVRPIGQVAVLASATVADSGSGGGAPSDRVVSVASPIPQHSSDAIPNGAAIAKSDCMTCHGPGLMDAPRVGDGQAWGRRLAQGYDALLQNALLGKGSMPARGGNAQLTDAQLTAAIEYMLVESGIADVPEAGGKSEDRSTPLVAGTMPASGAGSLPVRNASAPAAEQTLVVVPEPSSRDGDATGMEYGGAETLQISRQPEVAEAEPRRVPSTRGETVYESACASCHGSGQSDTPQIGDPGAWVGAMSGGLEHLRSTVLDASGRHASLFAERADLQEQDVDLAIQAIMERTFWPVESRH